MKYKLLIKSNHIINCICGKCPPLITIDESVKEEFKELMNWNETEFLQRTLIIQEKEDKNE